MKNCIITIYRNDKKNTRLKQKNLFINIMSNLFPKHDIFIIEQSKDNQKFNIGKLKNIGFDIAKNYDNYIFTDIDMIPNQDLTYYYSINFNCICSLAYKGTRYESINNKTDKIFLGGVIGVNKNDFIKINGYPNNFWGWGGEDDALIIRIYNEKLNICYPKKGKVIDTEVINKKKILMKNKMKILKNNDNIEKLKYEKILFDNKNYKKNGINSLNYKILYKTINKHIHHYIVDLEYEKDLIKQPQLFNFKEINYNLLKQKINDLYKKKTNNKNKMFI